MSDTKGVPCHLQMGDLMLHMYVDPPAEDRAVEATASPDVTVVEIVLRNGRELRLRGGLGDDDLARLIRLVESA